MTSILQKMTRPSLEEARKIVGAVLRKRKVLHRKSMFKMSRGRQKENCPNDWNVYCIYISGQMCVPQGLTE